MIDKLKGKYYARCDTCNTTAGAFDSFAEAVTYAKANHWRLVRTSGNNATRNYCPECASKYKKYRPVTAITKAASKNNLSKR
ncbi:hypothetical protein [Scatolibacter rhodanostii]|uniref:hypothetical protein n=1 Tax=Scatolibacter rhodanostii TaxID=2014781 RepID=UPI000C088B2D|nr:hypothetical protein [Scatolibacter rhodanostii]